MADLEEARRVRAVAAGGAQGALDERGLERLARPAPASGFVTFGGSSRTVMRSPSARITARSSTFSSSRTLPGQE